MEASLNISNYSFSNLRKGTLNLLFKKKKKKGQKGDELHASNLFEEMEEKARYMCVTDIPFFPYIPPAFHSQTQVPH